MITRLVAITAGAVAALVLAVGTAHADTPHQHYVAKCIADATADHIPASAAEIAADCNREADRYAPNA